MNVKKLILLLGVLLAGCSSPVNFEPESSNSASEVSLTTSESTEDTSEESFIETTPSAVEESEAQEPMTPEEASIVVGRYFGKTGTLTDENEYFFNLAWDAEKASIAYMREFAIKVTPSEFEPVVEWSASTFEEGTIFETCAYKNKADTVIQYYVYSAEVQGTDASCLEAYFYTDLC